MKKSVTLMVIFLASTAISASAQTTFNAGDFSDHQPDTANGEQIFNAGGCAACHAVDGDDTILAGGQEFSTKFGELYSPNITAHPDAGIGGWSNAEFLNALLHGQSPEGDTYFGAVFPYPSFARMKPEDALDMRAYMATLPQSDASSKEHNLSYMSQTILDLWSSSREEIAKISDPQMARGQYLVEAVGHCAECHTPRDTGFGFKYKLDPERPYEGEVGLLGEFAPDITAARLERFGLDSFVNGALAGARKLNGNPMVSASMRRIARATSNLPVEDRAAMYAYLTGKNIDASTLPRTTTIVPIVPVVTPVKVDGSTTPSKKAVRIADAIDDLTKAPALMAKVNAHCESMETPVELTTAPAPVAPVATAAPGVDPTLVKAADQLIETYCRSCHAPGKTYGAVFPTGDIADMPYDDKIIKPGNPEGSPLYESISSGRMPLGQKPTSDELDTLHKWITAVGNAKSSPVAASAATPAASPVPQSSAAPEFVPLPEFAGGERQERMLAVVADINKVNERDRYNMRYFSFARMPLAEIDCMNEDALRNPMHYMQAGLNKFLNSISLGPRVVAATPVPGTEGAVVRVDIRDYKWSEDDWIALSTGAFTHGAVEAGFSEEAWYDLAEVYPYAVDPSSDPLLSVVAQATGVTVPVMRADWVTHFASRAPYYDMFLGLTEQISDLEHRINIDVNSEILKLNIDRAAMLPGASGVSDHNRMLERFDLPRGGYYWKSYDFAGDEGFQSLVLYPDGPADLGHTVSGLEPFEHDGGEMIFSLPNGLQGYYLSTAAGDRLTVGPASIVSYRTKPIGKGVEIENARSCFDCHANGMIAKSDQLREMIEASTRYSRDELDILLEMYVDNDTLSSIFREDSDYFLNALSRLNATQKTASGRLTSLQAPLSVGAGEIVTYLADMHFDSIGLYGIAREFHMDVETFRRRATRLGDPTLSVVVSDWLSRLDAGGKIHRSELETYYAALLPRLTDLDPYTAESSYHVAAVHDSPEVYEQKVEKAVYEAVAKVEAPYKPSVTEYIKEDPAPVVYEDRLKLSLHVAHTDVYVNDLLEFDVSANKRCELQVFYIEESKNIEELPQSILGPQFLEPGETRRIPYGGSGLQIRFDEPGAGETMLAFCRENGLADHRMDSHSVLEYARTRSQPLTRGITIEAANRVRDDKGQSATNHVTFNVSR